ncbi:hypothetical protein DL89DRAFT_108314 [Linderina pennispora]|uniref:Uncharacterized protein n=1 Tax=Linderina pennispora TaxID=61395 RepID=A0A1Y1WF08_9FUNG|nr:uncharacterized protein DL89DRAFT_108314 [Linderina pennispora]ORX72119.1 hypothetical protein DL89DRAFT_108314 [Linderina pennispora]
MDETQLQKQHSPIYAPGFRLLANVKNKILWAIQNEQDIRSVLERSLHGLLQWPIGGPEMHSNRICDIRQRQHAQGHKNRQHQNQDPLLVSGRCVTLHTNAVAWLWHPNGRYCARMLMRGTQCNWRCLDHNDRACSRAFENPCGVGCESHGYG